MDFFDSYTPTSNITNPEIENKYSYLDFSGPTNYGLQQSNPDFYKAHLDVAQNIADTRNAQDYINSQLIRNPDLANLIPNPIAAPSRTVLPSTPNLKEEAPSNTTISTNDTVEQMAEKTADAIAKYSPSSDNYSWLDAWSNKTTTPVQTPTSTPDISTPTAELPDFKVDADPLQLQTLNYDKPVEINIAEETTEPIHAEPLSLPTIPAIDSSIAEDLKQKAKDAPMMARLDSDVAPNAAAIEAKVEEPSYPTNEDFNMPESGYYDDKGNLITDPAEIAKRDDASVRQLIHDYAGLEGNIVSGNLDADQLKVIAANLDAIPENRSTLEKVLDWGTNFITFGAKPNVPGRDIPLIKDPKAFAEACANGQDPKQLANMAFAAAGGSPKDGLEYYKITGDTNNNPYAEMAQSDITEAYNNVLNGTMSQEDFESYADAVLDSPWKNFNKDYLNNLKSNYIRSGAMAAGAAVGAAAGRVAQKVATKYPKVLSKIIKGNSKQYAQELVKTNDPAKLSTALQNGGIDKKLADKAAEALIKDPAKVEQLFDTMADRMVAKGSTSKAFQEAAEKLFVQSGEKVGGALMEHAVEKAKDVVGNTAGKIVAGATAAAPTIAGTIAGELSNEEAEAMTPADVISNPQLLMKTLDENKTEIDNDTMKPMQELLMGEDNWKTVYDRAVGNFNLGDSNTKAGELFDTTTKSFTDKASDIWNNENTNILSKVGSIIKETYNYAKEMKRITLEETSGGKIADAWKDITMDLLRVLFQGMAGAAGMDTAVITQILSNATRTGLIDQILELGGDLDDETRRGLEGLKDPDGILQPDVPDITEVKDEEVQRYNTNARDDSTLYNKGLRKEAYSDENVKEFISRVIPHEPILLKVSRFL